MLFMPGLETWKYVASDETRNFHSSSFKAAREKRGKYGKDLLCVQNLLHTDSSRKQLILGLRETMMAGGRQQQLQQQAWCERYPE